MSRTSSTSRSCSPRRSASRGPERRPDPLKLLADGIAQDGTFKESGELCKARAQANRASATPTTDEKFRTPCLPVL